MLLSASLDVSSDDKLHNDVSKMLQNLKEKGKNKVMWWYQKSIFLKLEEQFQA
jgi:hypothetical protein